MKQNKPNHRDHKHRSHKVLIPNTSTDLQTEYSDDHQQEPEHISHIPTEQELSANEFLYGIHTLEELLKARSTEIEEIWIAQGAKGKLARLAQLANQSGYLVRYRPRTYITQQIGSVNHQGVAIRTKQFDYCDLQSLLHINNPPSPLIFAIGIQDPGNLGALLRSARAFGVAGVILPLRNSCAITAAVHKSSVGATCDLPICRVRNINTAMRQMRDAGWWLLGLDGQAETKIDQFDLDRPAIFLLGSESTGLPPSIKKECDALLQIPMIHGWNSLNVAASGAIALYEWYRQCRLQPDQTSKT
jgi:23S rRNA (guanosine2251-2'-O)-methyltransferase